MLTKLYLEGDTFVIQKTYLSVILKLLFASSILLLMGYFFVKADDMLFKSIGYLLIALCIFLLVAMPYKALKQKGRDILRANYKGLTLFKNSIGVSEMFYDWDNIAMVLMADKLVIKEEEKTGWAWNDLMIFINDSEDIESIGIINMAQNNIVESPEGVKFIHLNLNKRYAELTLKYLRDVSGGRIEIKHHKEVIFDYNNQRIEYKA